MIQTLLFTDTSNANIEAHLNHFLQSMPVELIDIKVWTAPIGGGMYKREALVIYKNDDSE